MSSEPAEFSYSSFVANLTGWGPTVTNLVELKHLEGMPYQQYNKCDKIGRIMDWIGGIKKTDNRYNERVYGSSATAGTQFAYKEDNDDDFQLACKLQPPKQQFKGFRLFKQRRILPKRPENIDQRSTQAKRSIAKEHNRALKQWLSRGGNIRGLDHRLEKRKQYYASQEDNARVPSVQVRSDWKVIEVLDFTRLANLKFPNVGLGENITGESYGALYLYDKKIDQVSARCPIPFDSKKIRGSVYNITTTEDPTIIKLAEKKVGNVFATDIILATLMTAPRSVNSWDLVVSKVGSKLFFDKRDTDGYLSVIDALSVSETAVKPPSYNVGGINSAKNLTTEALYVNQNFRRQVLKIGEKEMSFKCKNERAPFETELKSECAYTYRVWSLGNMDDGTPIKLVARTENDGALLTAISPPKVQTLTIKAFNEWDSTLSGGMSWRSKIDVQNGAILATEIKNNRCKVAKWTIQAILGASDFIKFGFVSRIDPANSSVHTILATTTVKPVELCSRMSLDLDNCWGILRYLIDFFMKQENGDYLLLKDPLEPVIRIYCLPPSAFDEEIDSEDESDAGAN